MSYPSITARRASPEKRVTWNRCETAIVFLSENTDASYMLAARKFQVGVHQLKARVQYRYGSLADLREHGVGYMRPSSMVERECVKCARRAAMPTSCRMCDQCRKGG